MAEEEQVEPSTEETTEVEAETTETSEATEALSAEELADLRKKAGAFEDQRIRAEKAESALKKLKGSAQSSQNAPALSVDDQKRLDRIELNSLGIKDREEQDFVLGAAKRLGVEPSEAASDAIVSGKLDQMREAKKTKDATPAPSRGGQSTQNVNRLAEKALQTGELPTDPALRTKVREEMKRLTRNG